MALSASISGAAGCLEHGVSSSELLVQQTGGLHNVGLGQSCRVLPIRCGFSPSPCCRKKLLSPLSRCSAISEKKLSWRRRSLGNCPRAVPETSTSEVEPHETGSPSDEKTTPGASTSEDSKNDRSESNVSALSSLDSYFQQLAGSAAVDHRPVSTDSRPSATPPTASTSKVEKEAPQKGRTKDQEALSALDAYFNILNPPKPEPKIEKPAPVVATTAEKKETASKGLQEEVIDAWKKTFEGEGEKQEEASEELLRRVLLTAAQKEVDTLIQEKLSPWQRFLNSHTPNGVNTLAAISVAVYLFELASPETVPGNFATSLPNLFGAKVNELIALGEWWRLFTPSLLHSGFFHIGISVSTLLLFGPRVEAAYGTTPFVFLYFLTGAFGNLMSFAQTPDATIGGTGPLYGLVGAWLVFLIKNRDVIGKEQADNMTRQAIFLSALNVALGNPLPIDDWTHIGAALGGLLFGALAAPKLLKKRTNEDIAPIPDSEFRDISEVVGGQLDFKSAQKKSLEYTLYREDPNYRKLLFSTVVSMGIFVALLQVGLSEGVNVANVLQSVLNSDNIDFL